MSVRRVAQTICLVIDMRGDREREIEQKREKRGERKRGSEKGTETGLGNTVSHFISGLPFVITRVCSKRARRTKGERE